jgi:hypothetical protein
MNNPKAARSIGKKNPYISTSTTADSISVFSAVAGTATLQPIERCSIAMPCCSDLTIEL